MVLGNPNVLDTSPQEWKERIDLLACRLKLDDAVWGSRCHVKRGEPISSQQRSQFKPEGIGSRSSPLFVTSEGGRNGARCWLQMTFGTRLEVSVQRCLSVWLHQANGAFWPESQMAFGAFGALQSQRLRKLSAVFIVVKSRSREQQFNTLCNNGLLLQSSF